MGVLKIVASGAAALMMSLSAMGQTGTDCEAIYHAVTDAKAYPNAESKIRHLRDHGRECAGTGLYESRLGSFYAEAKDYDSAAKVLRAGLAHPNDYHQEIKYSLADLEVSRGQFDKALSDAKNLQAEHPEWFGGYMLAAKIMIRQGKFAESIPYSLESNKRSPVSANYLALAIAYHQLKQDEEAVKAGFRAIELDRTVVRAGAGMNETIYSLVRLNRQKDAAELAKSRMANDPAWRNDATFVKAFEYLHANLPEAFAGVQ